MLPATSDEIRAQRNKTRRLEIAAILARWKADYFAKGIERSFADRCALEAEDATLAFEARKLGEAVVIAKAARRELENQSLLTSVMGRLLDLGMENVLIEAASRSEPAADALAKHPMTQHLARRVTP
jgi:hypothetical protein